MPQYYYLPSIKEMNKEEQLIDETIKIKNQYGAYSQFLSTESKNSLVSEAINAFNLALVNFQN